MGLSKFTIEHSQLSADEIKPEGRWMGWVKDLTYHVTMIIGLGTTKEWLQHRKDAAAG